MGKTTTVIDLAGALAVAEAADLSVSEFEVLTRLWSEPGQSLPQLELATALNWSASRASRLLNRLGQRSFVTREGSGQGRARIVRLTEEDHRHLQGAFEARGGRRAARPCAGLLDGRPRSACGGRLRAGRLGIRGTPAVR